MDEPYDEAYERVPDLFGAEPDPLLLNHWERIDRRGPVLDIGAGQGRNALFLAWRCIRVDAIDPSAVAVRTIEEHAREKNLPLRGFHAGFESFEPPGLPYSAILVFGVVQVLSWKAIGRLAACIERWTAPESLLFVTAFTRDDAAFARYASEWKAAGRSSFESPGGDVRTFLEPGEILTLFPGFSAVHHHEGLGPPHRHGDGPVERHARAEALLERS